jgi:hypothetical protein
MGSVTILLLLMLIGGVPLPRIALTALDGSRVVLPDSAARHVTLVGFTFQRKLHKQFAARLEQFAAACPEPAGFLVYDVSMAGSRVPGFVRPLMNAAMRRATPVGRRKHTAPFYGDAGSYATALGVRGAGVFVVLLDREGAVCWRGSGTDAEFRFSDIVAQAFMLAGKGSSR